MRWDRAILVSTQHDYRDLATKRVMALFFNVGGELRGLALASCVLALLLLAGRIRDGAYFAFAVGGVIAVVWLLKSSFSRPPLIDARTAYFPSTHAAGCMAVAVTLCTFAWHTRWHWVCVTMGTLFVAFYGLSLVYFRSHYPSDVLAGWSLAIAWTMGADLMRLRPVRIRPGFP